jgi:hypothetical protein
MYYFIIKLSPKTDNKPYFFLNIRFLSLKTRPENWLIYFLNHTL